jgi:twitching motility protein PilT
MGFGGVKESVYRARAEGNAKKEWNASLSPFLKSEKCARCLPFSWLVGCLPRFYLEKGNDVVEGYGMETLKKILGAITLGAIKIELKPDSKPLFWGVDNEPIAYEFSVLDNAYLRKVLGILRGSPEPLDPPAHEPWATKISLGGTSTAQILVGHAHHFSVNIYLSPAADALFELDRKRMLQAPSSSGPSAASHQTAAAHSFAAQAASAAPASHQQVSHAQPQAHHEPVSGGKGKEISWVRDVSAEVERTVENPIDAVLTNMVKKRASDTHLTMGEPVVFRIDGEIVRVGDTPISPEVMRSYLDPIFPPANRQEFIDTSDTDFAYEVPNLGRFRFNVFRERTGVCAVARHIPSKIVSAEQLNLPKAVLDFCDLPKGLVLVTGPTGSGKSTTLAAMIDHINRNRHDHILTIEDPVEFVHPQIKCLVNQREVHKHTKSFARALKAALREDPDIVLIGEMRDLETIAIAIETAETGHLVFGTLHTNTAISTVDRIIDQFPADRQNQIRTMLSSSLKGVVSQLLLKKKEGGRVAALEILVQDDAVANMIREGKNHHIANHMQTSKARGNVLMNESLVKHVVSGAVDLESAYAKAPDKKSFLSFARAANLKIDTLESRDAASQNATPQAPGAPTASGAKLPGR